MYEETKKDQALYCGNSSLQWGQSVSPHRVLEQLGLNFFAKRLIRFWFSVSCKSELESALLPEYVITYKDLV